MLGRAAFVDVDVRRRVAVDGAERVREAGKRHAVRARAGRDREHRQAVVLERPPEARRHAAREVVVAVRRRRAAVGRDDRLEQLGRDAADVVAAEIVDCLGHRAVT